MKELIKAYAKVNLRLEVVGRLDNGYHDLCMINTMVDLCDYIYIEESTVNLVDFSVNVLNEQVSNPLLNILNDFKDKYKYKESYYVHVIKNIPTGAGLGGGSSDCAYLIKYLLKKHNIKLSAEELINVGLKYGADVPYCLVGKLAYVCGVGEKITLVDIDYNDEFILVNPNIFISTKDAFSNVLEYALPSKVDILIDYLEKKDYNALFYNDLEKASNRINDNLRRLKEELSNFGYVTMSGSGSTFVVKPFANIDDTLNDIKNKYNDYLIIKVKTI